MSSAWPRRKRWRRTSTRTMRPFGFDRRVRLRWKGALRRRRTVRPRARAAVGGWPRLDYRCDACRPVCRATGPVCTPRRCRPACCGWWVWRPPASASPRPATTNWPRCASRPSRSSAGRSPGTCGRRRRTRCGRNRPQLRADDVPGAGRARRAGAPRRGRRPPRQAARGSAKTRDHRWPRRVDGRNTRQGGPARARPRRSAYNAGRERGQPRHRPAAGLSKVHREAQRRGL